MAGAVDDIRDWATGLEYWEQAALEQIVSDHAFTDADYNQLLELFLQDAGLALRKPGSNPILAFPGRLASGGNVGSCRLERLFNLRDVNALPPQQEIRFGPQLTIIYGGNSVGKTGYARPLGCAAFARGDRDVLTDARKQASRAVPCADIEISRNGTLTTVTWQCGSRCSELAGVYVFDGASVSAHLNQSNALSFSPSGLSLLTKLAEVTDSVRGRLRVLIESRSKPHSFSPLFPGDSVVSREIAKLGANTDMAALEKLAQLSAKDEQQIDKLDFRIAELKSQDIAKRMEALSQESHDLQGFLDRIEQTTKVLGLDAEEQIKKMVASLQSRREDAERVGADQFRFDRFTQVGTDVWREFVVAAKALADAEAQRGTVYPQEGDHCLLCRQRLSPDAVDLINRLWAFMISDAPRRLKESEQACVKHATELRGVDLGYFGPDSPVRRILQAEALEIIEEIDGFLEKCSLRRGELETCLTTGTVEQLTPITPPNLFAVREAVGRRAKEIADLQKSDYKQQFDALSQELRELQHRRALRDHWEELKAWVKDQKWAVDAQKKVGSTHHITAKYNELFKALVTDQYRESFQAILEKFKRNLKVSIETRGQKGTTVRQIVLSPEAFVQKLPIEKILSDGEKRAVALVDFLTEASLDPSSTVLVLDDPVSSMDSDSKRAAAEILAELAAKRQVILFTHDLTFLHALKSSASKMCVDVTSHWIRTEEGQPGFVYLDNSPTCEGDYKSAKKAREYHAEAKSAPPGKQEALLQQGFGALRSSYEAFVIYGLFNDVVRRFDERVSFDRLKDVRVDQEILDEVVERMSVLSRYIDAHLHSDAYAAEKPTPESLLKEIEDFDALRNKHREKKKASPTSDSKPAGPNATARAPGNADQQPSMPDQPGTTVIN